MNLVFKPLAANALGGPFYDFNSTVTEYKALASSLIFRPDLIHMLYVENNFGLLKDWRKRLGFRIIGTAHQPENWWQSVPRSPSHISSIDALIVVSSREASYFDRFLPGRVHYIPHGIDTSFFRPGDDHPKSTRKDLRCVFSGRWLRDIGALTRIVDIVLSRNPLIRFDMIVPQRYRKDPVFSRLSRYSQVSWHADLSDEQLLQLYRCSSMLVLPVLDSTANNALLEAMACGLPVISNKVGGVLDYTDTSFAELFSVGDVDGPAAAILHLTDNPEERQERGRAARLYTEQHFSWQKIADDTLAIYDKTLKS